MVSQIGPCCPIRSAVSVIIPYFPILSVRSFQNRSVLSHPVGSFRHHSIFPHLICIKFPKSVRVVPSGRQFPSSLHISPPYLCIVCKIGPCCPIRSAVFVIIQYCPIPCAEFCGVVYGNRGICRLGMKSLNLCSESFKHNSYNFDQESKTQCSIWFWHTCDLETRSRSANLVWLGRPQARL